MSKILFPGELLIDRYTTPTEKVDKTGGAPANAAVAARKLGLTAVLITAVGSDDEGISAVHDVERYGVSLKGLQIVAQPTTVANVTIDASGERSFTFSRGADAELDFVLIPDYLLKNYTALHLGSATAMLGGKTWETYLKLLNHAASHKAVIAVDPNYRAALFANDIINYKKRINMLLEKATIVKMSTEEIMILYHTNDYVKAANNILAAGAKIALITLGKTGSYLATATNQIVVPSIKVKQIDSTGAGDTFIGYFLGKYIKHLATEKRMPTDSELVVMVRYANVAAALATTKIGAMNAIPNANEVEAHYAKEVWK